MFDFTYIFFLNFQVDDRKFIVEIIDSVEDYLQLMKDIFDFDKLKTLIKGVESKPFNILIDSMNGGKFGSLGPCKKSTS